MSVTVTGASNVRRELAEVEALISSTKPMEGFLGDAQAIILERTAGGKDYKNRSFEPYSAAYAKEKKGMTATGRPNLKRTGTMLGAMFTKVISAVHGQIDIGAVSEKGRADSEMLAQIHNTGTGKQPRREFMNLSDSTVSKLKKKWWDDPILEIVRRYR